MSNHYSAANLRFPGDDARLDEAVAIFVRMRPRMLAIAYRVLGGANEVEDVVQEIWVRWQNMDRSAVTDPQALLLTMTTRLAINVHRSARYRRETTGAVPTLENSATGDDPATTAEDRDTIAQAVLVMMERLTPRERAAFVLRDAFDYPYGQLSDFLQLRSDNARQVVSRARRRLAAVGPPPAPGPAASEHFVRAFLDASRSGDLTTFEQVLAHDLAG
ncbi:sigma-70 family RNA polymerase sigma factor [Kribbella sp. NPDC000426]|uniref:sigma-70 family RNA polymerase sigma factor n=1 Tax=Kribbella sp. NPDC000426 TaxID=3154255 RepID=UPI0033287268